MERVADLLSLKQKIWQLCGKSKVNLWVAAQKAGVFIPHTGLTSITDAEAILKILTKPRRITPPVPQWVKDRYNEAHRVWVQREAPQYYKAGYSKPVFPKVHTSNGLTNFALDLITWHGYRATRVSSAGRMIAGKWIPGGTRAGSADISATIQGKSVMIEIKVGMDRPSEKQLKEQARECKAGGVYEFVRSAGDVINLFDSIIYG